MRKLLLFVVLVLSVSAQAQMLPAGITPQMVQQLQSLPPEQQRALAKQYGITLPSGDSSQSGESTLGKPGEPLTQNPLLYSSELGDLFAPESARSESDEPENVRYGRDLFNREVSTFAPTDDAPVPDTYRLGVGDQLIVQLFGKENETLNLQVGRDGTVTFPRLGLISIGGLTFEDARDLIKTRVQQQLIGVEAVATMGRLRAISIFMAGEVQVPGTYSVSALTTVTQALFQAGGVTDIGALRNIQVRRGGETVATFDTYQLLMKGDASGDIRLQSGDVVFVPPYNAVATVEGEVKRPMMYELLGGETLADLVDMAGRYTQSAFPTLAVLTRIPGNGELSAAISLNLLDQDTQNLAVADGDVLRVPRVGKELANTVTLTGAVNRPGDYGWFDGMRVSSILRNARVDLLKDADLSFGVIVEPKNRLLDIAVKQFSVIDAIAYPGTERDPLLKEFSEVLIFSSVTAVQNETLLDQSEKQKSDADSERANFDNLNELEQMLAIERVRKEEAKKAKEAEEEQELFDRQTLLEPVIAKLRSQARKGEDVQLVSISGAVFAPGIYPLFSNATAVDLIAAAGGLKDSAFASSAELRSLRAKPDGGMAVNYQELNLEQAMEGVQNPRLNSRDHITVRDIPDWSPRDQITISGEVKFPGSYLIQPGETLSDVIKRAGGLTDEAFAEAAVFTREEIARREAERSSAFAADIRQTYASRLLTEETTSNTLADIAEITKALETFEGRGRMLIDLPLALAGDAAADLEVTDGDKLVIPKRVNTVTVVGEVYQQGTHTFASSNRLEDYLSLSAGLTARADDKAIYVVKANGTVAALDSSWWRFGGATQRLAPGDTIVVPVNSQYKESLASWREITQIVYQSLISVAAVANL